jgi:hypothetical protein
MLNHLEREEIFVPEKNKLGHHGKHREYTFRDLIILRAINRLLCLGARPKRIKDSIATFAGVCPSAEGSDKLLEFANSSCLFVVTNSEVIFCESPEKLVDLAKGGQLAFSFMVDNGHEIAPAVRAGVSYLEQIRNGAVRSSALLEETALKFGL